MSATKARRLALSVDRMLNTDFDASVSGRRDLDPRLHGYQVRAVHHLQDHPRSALFLEMGLGKTAAALQALTPEHLPALVLAPKRITENVWAKEAKTWRPDLDIGIAMGTPAKRQAVLDAGHEVTVISKDNMAQVEPGWFRTLIFDELSLFKNPSTKGFKTAKRLVESCPHVWGLTGTPAPNGYGDLWGEMFLIDRGVRLKRTQTAFRQKWFYPGRQLPSGVVIEWKMRDGAQDEIDGRLGDLCLSMKASDYLELAEPRINEVEVVLPPAVKAQYDDMEKSFVLRSEADLTYSASNAAAAQNKLSQITAGFVYPDVDELDPVPTAELHRLKFKAVAEVVEGTGSPVLVFYRFKHERDQILKEVPQARLATEDGVIEGFENGRVEVMLAHPKSMGYGLNLQYHCHTVVWSTMPWALDEYQQANARIARQGQTKPVVIHLVTAAGTVDQVIRDALERKDDVQDALMTALSA